MTRRLADSPLDPATWGDDVLAHHAELATDGPKPTAKGRSWAVAVEHPYAALTGQKVIEAGGSAADAFVAIAAVKHVVMPGTTTLGGVFGAIYYDAASGETHAINAGLAVPMAEDVLGGSEEPWDHLAMKGTGRAVLVPGVVRGLESLHKRFGRLRWADLWLPAIHFAREGFPMYELYWNNLNRRKEVVASREGGRASYLPDGGMPPTVGAYRQLVLAQTLEQIATRGADHCYTGNWARALVAEVQDAGGRMTLEDLARYEVRWEQPIVGSYLGHQVHVPRPPHYAGVNVLVGLRVLEALGSHQRPPAWDDAQTLREHIQAWKLTLDLPASLLDGTLATAAQTDELNRVLSRQHAAEMAALIREHGVVSADHSAGVHSHNVILADADGSMMAATYTIHSDSWGDSGIIVGGISLNSSAFQLANYRPPPGGRIAEPLSPYIAFRDGRPVLAASAIGSGLLGCQLQNTENVLARAMGLGESVAAPRYGFYELDIASMTMTDKVQVEPFAGAVLDEVEAAGQPLLRSSYRWEGHATADTGYWAAIAHDADGEEYEAVVDPRLPGLAVAG